MAVTLIFVNAELGVSLNGLRRQGCDGNDPCGGKGILLGKGGLNSGLSDVLISVPVVASVEFIPEKPL